MRLSTLSSLEAVLSTASIDSLNHRIKWPDLKGVQRESKSFYFSQDVSNTEKYRDKLIDTWLTFKLWVTPNRRVWNLENTFRTIEKINPNDNNFDKVDKTNHRKYLIKKWKNKENKKVFLYTIEETDKWKGDEKEKFYDNWTSTEYGELLCTNLFNRRKLWLDILKTRGNGNLVAGVSTRSQLVKYDDWTSKELTPTNPLFR